MSNFCCNFEGTDTATPSHLESTVASCSPYAREKVFLCKRRTIVLTYEGTKYLSVSELPIGTLCPHTHEIIATFAKKMPFLLHMCNFCCTFAENLRMCAESASVGVINNRDKT